MGRITRSKDIQKINEFQRITIENLLRFKDVDIQELTKQTIGIVVDSIDLLSHEEATAVIRYGVCLKTE